MGKNWEPRCLPGPGLVDGEGFGGSVRTVCLSKLNFIGDLRIEWSLGAEDGATQSQNKEGDNEKEQERKMGRASND